MQTLNVGAGRTDEEYKAAEEQRRADLRSDVQTYAFYFFVAAGLAAVGTGLLLFKMNIIVNIGAIDLFPWYARDLIQSNPLLFIAPPQQHGSSYWSCSVLPRAKASAGPSGPA